VDTIRFRPDGRYIPRVLFLDKNGDLLADFKNKKAEYKNYRQEHSWLDRNLMVLIEDVLAITTPVQPTSSIR